MDYSSIIQELDEASLFDIYRLSVALNQELSNPSRVQEIKSKLVSGQVISWFDAQKNREEKAEVVRCNKSRVLIKNLSDGVKWNIFYSSINMQEVEVEIKLDKKFGLRKQELSLGEIVAFTDRYNVLIFGQVIKLNPKTARIDVGDYNWDVSYNLLRKTSDIEAELAEEKIFISDVIIDV